MHLILPVFVAFAEKKSGGSVTRLARVDAQREKLSGQLSELEATERVLAFYAGPLEARICAKATGWKKAAGEAYTETGCPSRIEIRCRE